MILGACIVTYNNPKYFRNAFLSLIACDRYGFDLEVFAVEGGSQDSYNQALDATKDRGRAYVSHLENPGWAGGCNYLASLAIEKKCTHLLQTNDDIIYAPSFLQNMVEGFKEPNTEFVGTEPSGLSRIEGNRLSPTEKDIEDWAKVYSPTERRYGDVGGNNSAAPWILSTRAWQEASQIDVWIDSPPLPFNKYQGAIDESIDPYLAGWCTDWDFLLRVETLGYRMGMCNEAGALHYGGITSGRIWQENNHWGDPAARNIKEKIPAGVVTVRGRKMPDWYPAKRC